MAKGGGNFEILISEKDQKIIDERRQHEESEEKDKIQELEYNYNQYLKYISGCSAVKKERQPVAFTVEMNENNKEEQKFPLSPEADDDNDEQDEEIDFDQLLGDAA